ncbi:hypothetical protein BGZ60DRAFT_389427 [Tricladium varicosporioides]|nr:hypothetical protein BGZ60DRAFT_389427 [Hymenoscyphus varicosporioides]
MPINGEHTPLIGGSYGNDAPPWYQFRPSRDDTLFRRILFWPIIILDAVWQVLRTTYINILLIFLPFSLISIGLSWPPMVQFFLSFLAIIPLSSLIEFATEEISMRLGSTLGGLLNACLGNVVEIIVCILFLNANETTLVQAILMGNLLYHTLFGPGCCIFIGGFQNLEQHNYAANTTMSFVMVVATAAMFIPTFINSVVANIDGQKNDLTSLSHGLAVLFLVVYLVYLFFSLRTHVYIFEMEEDDFEEEDYSDEPTNPWYAALILALVISLVAICGKGLVANVDVIVAQTHSSRAFIGFIMLPFLSNTATTITTMVVAFRCKMDLALGVAIGSGLQIVLFVVPLLVLVGWTMSWNLTMDFGSMGGIVLVLSSLLMAHFFGQEKSNYLDGVLCLCLYIVIAASLFVLGADRVV